MPSSAVSERSRHAPTTIALHWLTAILVVLLWTIGQTIDFVPRGALRVDYRSLHLLLGAMLGIVLVVRLVWRTTKGGLLPALQEGPTLAVSHATHWLLYALLLAAVVLGVATAWARGDSIFNVVQLPQLFPGDRARAHQVGEWHALAANAIMIVAGMHSAAALFHHFVLHDVTLRRMLPWAKRLP